VNKGFLGIAAGLVIGATGTALFLKYPIHGSQPEAAAPGEEVTSFVQQDANGPAKLKLDAETQTRMGLKTAALAAAQLQPEVKGYGRVLDAAPLVALAAESASAKASLEASRKEYDRLKVLYSQNQNASARALETAEAALKRDQIQYESIQPRLLSSWGRGIASQPDLAAFARSLAAQETALVRIDPPLGENPEAPPTGGRVASLAAPARPIPVAYLGPAADTDPQLQTRGYLFLMKTDPFPPGTMVMAWLTIPGPAQAGAIVPRDAVIRYQGDTFVYLRTAADTFQREAITLGRPTAGGWFVAATDHSPVRAQDEVVTVGAGELLSEELKGQEGGD
jgi:hypothetical protein